MCHNIANFKPTPNHLLISPNASSKAEYSQQPPQVPASVQSENPIVSHNPKRQVTKEIRHRAGGTFKRSLRFRVGALLKISRCAHYVRGQRRSPAIWQKVHVAREFRLGKLC